MGTDALSKHTADSKSRIRKHFASLSLYLLSSVCNAVKPD